LLVYFLLVWGGGGKWEKEEGRKKKNGAEITIAKLEDVSIAASGVPIRALPAGRRI
jgi:hypothetical protein